MNEICKINLIEEFACHFMEVYGLPPLAAKIHSYILLDCKQTGITFDELVEVFNVSKSSVSNSLHLLTQHKHIEQFTKIDCRKRYYRVSSGHLLWRLNNIFETLKRERRLNEKLNDYRESVLKEQSEPIIHKTSIYIKHLDESIERMSNTIKELENLTQK